MDRKELLEYFPYNVGRNFTITHRGIVVMSEDKEEKRPLTYSPEEMKANMLCALSAAMGISEEERPQWLTKPLCNLLIRAFNLYRFFYFGENCEDLNGLSIPEEIESFIETSQHFFRISSTRLTPGVILQKGEMCETIFVEGTKFGTAVFYNMILCLIYGKRLLENEHLEISRCISCGNKFFYYKTTTPRKYCDECRGKSEKEIRAFTQKKYRERKKEGKENGNDTKRNN